MLHNSLVGLAVLVGRGVIVGDHEPVGLHVVVGPSVDGGTAEGAGEREAFVVTRLTDGDKVLLVSLSGGAGIRTVGVASWAWTGCANTTSVNVQKYHHSRTSREQHTSPQCGGRRRRTIMTKMCWFTNVRWDKDAVLVWAGHHPSCGKMVLQWTMVAQMTPIATERIVLDIYKRKRCKRSEFSPNLSKNVSRNIR
jgi:hypothetical protein